MSRDAEDAAPHAAVLGGGVIGITTAIHLQLAGYETAVHTARIPFEDDGGPTLATTYAAASVKPAHVTMRDLADVLARSRAAFDALAEDGSMGVRVQPHFDLFETDRADPAYASVLEGFERVGDLDDHPHRPGAEAVFGWRFDVHFVEMPTYVSRCYELYRALGGEVHRRERSREAFLDLPGDALVNCTGYWARDLVDDPRPMAAHVGHQVLARGLPPIRDPNGGRFSYSYSMPPAVDDGPPGGLYAYPRTDALVLGGSRIRADVDPGEDWEGADAIEGPTRTVDGVAVPARIVEANADLLASYAGVDLDGAELTARYGYRPLRDPEGEGVRLERERLDGRTVVHNYGHGGAGVTLSWGSAERVTGLVREAVEAERAPIDVPPEFEGLAGLATLVGSDAER